MEQDKQLKELLAHSADGASAQFTDAVMRKVTALSTTPFYYQPLVPPKLKKAFLATFLGLVVASFVLCIIANPSQLNLLVWIQMLPFSAKDYTNVLVFLLIFWTVFAVNALFQKSNLLSRRATFF